MPTALDSWSTGLGKMVKEPWARFPVIEWGYFVIRRGYETALSVSS